MSGDLISIHRRGLFNLEEARAILPIVRRITQTMSEKVDALIADLESAPSDSKGETAPIEREINLCIHQWNEKIKKLGAIPKGLWLVDFEFGRGYYCWKFPEIDILHWHPPEDDYTGRRPLEDLSFEKKKNHKTTFANRPGANRRPTREL